MKERVRSRSMVTWAVLLGAVLLAVALPREAGSRGFQCFQAEFTVLEQTLDLTRIEIEFGPVDEPAIPTFTVALPTNQRPTVWVTAVDGVPLDTPFEDTQAVAMANRPSRAQDVWIWDYRTWFTRRAVRGVPLGFENALRATIEIRHPAPAAMFARLERARALDRQGFALNDDALQRPLVRALTAAVVNGRAAADMIRAREAGGLQGPVDDLFARSPRWVRIEVEESGFHRIDYARLRAAIGADVDVIDPSTLRLFGADRRSQAELPETSSGSWNATSHLRERPLLVRASGPTFGPADEIVVYLPGVSGWSDEYDVDADLLDQDELSTADRVAHWLTWDEVEGDASDFDGAPLRMLSASGTPTGASRVVADGRVRSHFEENLQPGFGLARDDWAWRTGIGTDQSVRLTFELEDVVVDSVSWFEMPLVATRNGGDAEAFAADVSINGQLYPRQSWDYVDQAWPDATRRAFARFGGVPLRSGPNTMDVTNRAPARTPRMIVDDFDVTWRRALRIGETRLEWFVPAGEATTARWRFDVAADAGELGGAWVFDRSDPWDPVLVTGSSVENAGSALRFELDLVAGRTRHLTVLTNAQLLVPASLERTRPRLLRREVTDAQGQAQVGYDMVILHPEIFTAAAEDVVALRRQRLPGVPSPRVTNVLLQDVYDQFGHGTKDPAAIRNYLKFLYELDRRLTYVLLVGDTNRDARGVLPSSDPDFCPTFVQDYWPQEGTKPYYTSIPFARDEWFVSFHDRPTDPNRPFGRQLDLPDVTIGRLPVTSVAEASRSVSRLLDYELDPAPGVWRNRVLLAADDNFAASNNDRNEREHIDEAECVAERLLPPALDVHKLYLTEYEPPTPSSLNKPEARIDFRDEWSDGALIVHYIGHGSPEQMADEVLFRIEDVASLGNDVRLPLFLAFSCDVAIYDDPNTRSMSEQLVLQERGGSIAAIAASEVTFSNYNEELTEAFYTQLWPDQEEPWNPATRLGPSQPVGLALLAGKWSAPGWQSTPVAQNNNAKYVLLGDPAMRLRAPLESVDLAGPLAEAFRSGQELRLNADVDGIAGSGAWYVEAQESARRVGYQLPNGTTLPYVLDGAAFFRGNGRLDATGLDLAVRTPATMRFGPEGRLRVLLEIDGEQYVGLVDSLDVVRAPVDSDDAEGPTITLDFDQRARRVQPGSVLLVTIEDASGINTLGTTPGNSILYELGDSGVTTDVTEDFALDEGSTTRGTVEVPLREVEPGNYTLRLTASDMLGNGGAGEIDFEVVAGGEAEIGNHVPVPNPFRESTSFVVDVISPIGLAADLEIDIVALDGSPVRTLRSRLEGGGGRAVVEWDGRDRRGDEIANGTYLYVVRAHFPTLPPVTETSTGRVVLMR